MARMARTGTSNRRVCASIPCFWTVLGEGSKNSCSYGDYGLSPPLSRCMYLQIYMHMYMQIHMYMYIYLSTCLSTYLAVEIYGGSSANSGEMWEVARRCGSGEPGSADAVQMRTDGALAGVRAPARRPYVETPAIIGCAGPPAAWEPASGSTAGAGARMHAPMGCARTVRMVAPCRYAHQSPSDPLGTRNPQLNGRKCTCGWDFWMTSNAP